MYNNATFMHSKRLAALKGGAGNKGRKQTMNFSSNVKALIQDIEFNFDIVEEYKALNVKRKLLICDHLFLEGRKTFHGTVEMLWPEADDQDMRKLEKFLVNMKTKAN
jgi:hypothetical protein